MNSIEKKLEISVLDYLIDQKIARGSVIIIAFSGGPDSTALLLALCNVCNHLELKLKMAYVNHGIRDDIELGHDDDFVRYISRKYDIELFEDKIPSGEIISTSKKEGRSSEEVARTLRYNFFDSILSKFNNALLALGHNQDDQFETMIMRFFQGTGIGGLKGIPCRNNKIIRPLINCQKSEILSYLNVKNELFRLDPSNFENDFLRNKIRNCLIPEIKKIFPGYNKSMKSVHNSFSDLNNFLDEETNVVQCDFSREKCSVDLNEYNNINKVIRLHLLYKMFDHTYNGGRKSFRVPERFFNKLINNLENNRVYAIAYGIKIFTESGQLSFIKYNNTFSGFYYIIDNKTEVVINHFILKLVKKSEIKIVTDFDSPLIVRSKKDGDSIMINEDTKSVKRIFSQWKVVEEKRNLIPIVEDSEGIVCILGSLYGYKNIFREKKMITSQKFNILYLEVREIKQE